MKINPSLLEPTLLWENSNPNNTYVGGSDNEIIFNDLTTNYKYIVFMGKVNENSVQSIQVIGKVAPVNGERSVYLSLIDDTSSGVFHRGFKFLSNGRGYFLNGYFNNSASGNYLIPTHIYGTNTL